MTHPLGREIAVPLRPDSDGNVSYFRFRAGCLSVNIFYSRGPECNAWGRDYSDGTTFVVGTHTLNVNVPFETIAAIAAEADADANGVLESLLMVPAGLAKGAYHSAMRGKTTTRFSRSARAASGRGPAFGTVLD